MALPVREMTLTELLNTTRSSKAWYFDANGDFQEAANDVARIDHDPGNSNAVMGLMSEGASTNLFLHSEDLSKGVWSKGRVTIGTPTTFAANISLDELVEDVDTGSHSVFQQKSVASGALASVSFKLKAKERTTSRIQLYDNDNSINQVDVEVDLSAGTLGAVTTGGNATGAVAKIRPLGDGVYRVTVTGAFSGATVYVGRAYIGDGASFSYTGDGTSGLYIGAAQLEELPFASSYIPTGASQVTRAADNHEIASLDPWYRAAGYAVEVEWKALTFDSGLSRSVCGLSDGTTNNYIAIRAENTNNIVMVLGSTGGTFQDPVIISQAAAGIFRVACRVLANDWAASINGASVVAKSNSMPQAATLVGVGRSVFGEPTFGWIRDFKFVTDPALIASKYTDAELAIRSTEYV